jgi:holliday junction DNA helicase RuvA
VIAKLRGILDTIGEDWLILDVNGVGYLVYASSRLLSQLPECGQPIQLLIEPVLRNEQTHLFGFSSRTDQEWFRLLTTVQGVGAKVALAIQSALSGEELTQAIIHQDKTMISRADGVGPKLASRIAAELKDKVNLFSVSSANLAVSPTIQSGGSIQDAISALENLGYRRAEASAAIAQAVATLGHDQDTPHLIRQALSHLSALIIGKTS